METDQLKIYIHRLKDDQEEILKESLSPNFLDVHESDLKFPSLVELSGRAYLTGDHLILHLQIKTCAELPCMICNESTSHILNIPEEIISIPIKSLKKPVYDYTEKLREIILLGVPSYIECNEGKCPSRTNLKKHFTDSEDSDPQYFPFANLE